MPPTPHYPVSLVVAGRRCLVVGGATVATHKATTLLECGALVTMVAPEISDDARRLSAGWPLTLERRRYAAGEAAGYRLVVTATGVDEVDGAVSADAEAAGVWVNSADDPRRCTFFLPSVHRDGPVTVAVSTGGASPALARWLRRRLAASAGAGLGTLADLLDEARRRLQADGRGTQSVDWEAVLDGALPGLAAAGRVEEAREVLRRVTG